MEVGMTGTTVDDTDSEQAVLARRFLHVNLNVRNAERAVQFYEAALGLQVSQRTDSSPFDGEQLGFTGYVTNDCVFMYDWRGPRSGASLELLQWNDPETAGEVYDDPTSPGIHSLVYAVRSAAQAAEALRAAGGTVIAHAQGCFAAPAPAPTVIGQDRDGALVELIEQPADGVEAATLIGMRISCADLDASLQFYTAIGFRLLEAPTTGSYDRTTITPADRGPQARIARVALPEDEPSLVLVLVELPTAAPRGPGYLVANHVGLFRMALRVEGLDAARAIVTGKGMAMRGPYEVELPGTRFDPLRIGFMTDPNGVVVEFVERSASLFRPPRLPRATS